MLKIFNSMSRKIEEVIVGDEVKMYTCGPTVYSYPTIGNWRTYVLSDLLNRVLKMGGKKVDLVMNLTDVGHLTGDNEGDADTGEDRLEKAAIKEKKTAWDIAKFYSEDFLEGFKKLNMIEPMKFAKATEYIEEQINLVKRIEERGFTYQIGDGIYFSVGEYEKSGNIYGELSNLDVIKEGARVEINPEKKDPRDFALWKFSPPRQGFAGQAHRDMEWESPWGLGFPGWHIECSAMSRELLGEQIDIHVGGEDLKSTHHPNEIAQSEAASGKKPFVKYWVHGVFLLVDGKRMGKSMGNAYTLGDIEAKGFSPIDLRYLYLSSHYRTQMNFTWEALEAAQNALVKLNRIVSSLRGVRDEAISDAGIATALRPRDDDSSYYKKFREAVEDDLNMAGALAVVWEVVKSDLSNGEKKNLILEFDEVLGLDLKTQKLKTEKIQNNDEIKGLLEQREKYRLEKNWVEADKIRDQLTIMGYEVKDK